MLWPHHSNIACSCHIMVMLKQSFQVRNISSCFLVTNQNHLPDTLLKTSWNALASISWENETPTNTQMVPSTMMWKYGNNLSFFFAKLFNFSPFLAHSGRRGKKSRKLDWFHNYDILQMMIYQHNCLGTPASWISWLYFCKQARKSSFKWDAQLF